MTDDQLAASIFRKLFNGDEMWVDWGDPVNDYLLVDGLVRGITAEEFAYLEQLAASMRENLMEVTTGVRLPTAISAADPLVSLPEQPSEPQPS